MSSPYAAMLRYNEWANRTLFEDCRALSDEQLDTRASESSASVRELLTHIAGGQRTIVGRMIGEQQSSWDDWPGFDALLKLLTRSNDELMAAGEAVREDDSVEITNGGRRYRFPKSFLLAQAVTHGAEHRTEIKLLLASIGVATPDLDSWSYARGAGFIEGR
jgi:uncharacterized damage-inducible protein DinB